MQETLQKCVKWPQAKETKFKKKEDAGKSYVKFEIIRDNLSIPKTHSKFKIIQDILILWFSYP